MTSNILTLQDGFGKDDLLPAVEALKKGGIIAFPTETVYGLGCDSFSKIAIKKLYQIKKREKSKVFSILLNSPEEALSYFEKPSGLVKTLLKKFSPGPLTIISKASKKVPDSVMSDNGTVGIRIPNHPVLFSLLSAFGRPMASTSANPKGLQSSTSVDQVLSYFPSGIKIIISSHDEVSGVSSTIIECIGEDFTIIREGSISKEKIWSAIMNNPAG